MHAIPSSKAPAEYIALLSAELASVMQKVPKQGIHNLKSQQYQLLYVDDGQVRGDDQEDWKVLKASETY